MGRRWNKGEMEKWRNGEEEKEGIKGDGRQIQLF